MPVSAPTHEKDAIVALGSNLSSEVGPPRETLAAAVARIAAQIGPVTAVSGLYESAPVPLSDQPTFLNTVILVETRADSAAVLQALHAMEAEFGRVRAARWAARVLDLDLIAHGARCTLTPDAWQRWVDRDRGEVPERLILPHPRAHARRFVLQPLQEAAPWWRHPILDRPARDLPGYRASDQQCERVGPLPSGAVLRH